MLAEELVPERGNLENFIGQFSVFAESPGGVKQLRALIMKLAVKGSLIPQSEQDPPVTDYLRRIATLKTSISENRKKGKASIVELQYEELQTLPANWVWRPLGEITINRDAERIPLSRAVRDGKKGSYPYYGASGVIDEIDEFIFEGPLLLIGEDGANLVLRSTPIAFIANGQFWVNNHAHVLDSFCVEALEYLALYINSISLEPYITGMAQPKMNQKRMNAIPVPIPPLAEQKRIVAKVDELMALCDQLEAQQQQQANSALRANTAAIAALLNSESHSTNPLANKQDNADIATATAGETNKIKKPTFEQNWQRIAQHFNTLYGCTLPMPPGEGRQKKHLVGLANVKALKQTIIQCAINGKLTYRGEQDCFSENLKERILESNFEISSKLNLKFRPFECENEDLKIFPLVGRQCLF